MSHHQYNNICITEIAKEESKEQKNIPEEIMVNLKSDERHNINTQKA